MQPVAIDFETFGILPRPDYPPRPVGVSIKYPNKESYYYAFGHPTENNCTWEDAAKALEDAYNWPGGILFQNAKFDLDVAETFFNLKPPTWEKIHDTLFLLFLDDPNQTELGLKPSAERLLNLPPEEQDAVGDWLVEKQPIEGVKISKTKSGKNYFGKYIAYAPGALVGIYANGDVDRTLALFNLLYERIKQRGMEEAYNRERKLMLILLEMERQGLPVDLPRLMQDVAIYTKFRVQIDSWLFEQLGTNDINLDSGAQLVAALLAAKKIDESKLKKTATGKYSSTKESLHGAIADSSISAILQYRTQLNTCMNTFMIPWLAIAAKTNGLIFTTWNQTKMPAATSNIGTRTGRLSSTPNFQNIPKTFKPLFAHEAPGLPECPIKDLPPLPNMRSYVIPFPGHVLIDRDYSQQEPRILAHFDDGNLMQTYIKNPWTDLHDHAKAELEKVGKFYERKAVKNTNLGLIYGMGIKTLAERNNMTHADAQELKAAILNLYPGLAEMYSEMRRRAKCGVPLRTWGGREYFCEPSKIIKGEVREFDYKMVNALIQGSAADCTKEAIIRYYHAKSKNARIILNVHDQITVSVPADEMETEMEKLKACMESIEFDVLMLSEGTISTTNWAELITYDKKGVKVYGK